MHCSMHWRCFNLWGVCFGIFSNANPILATYGYLQLPCIIFMFWIIHRSHSWHPEVLWLFNPNLFAQITSYLFTNLMNQCSFSFENNTGGHLVIGIWVIYIYIKSHIPWLWATKQIHFIGTIKCFFFQTNLLRRECLRWLEWKIYFQFHTAFPHTSLICAMNV